MQKYIEDSFNQSANALSNFMRESSYTAIENAARIMIQALRSGNTIYSCGNGGSMSDAMHFAEELTGRYRDNRAGLSATSISDPGHITCVANDFGYEFIFSRYLQAKAKEGDVLLAISTSGGSKNVVNAANWAKENDVKVVSLTGKPYSTLGLIADVDIATGSFDYADRAQELHIKIIHCLIELIEREFFPNNYS